MGIQGLHCASVPDIEVEADVGAVIGFKVVVLPGNDDGLLWAAGLLG